MPDRNPVAICTCGHALVEHQGGERCEACSCKMFELVIPTSYLCIECGEPAITEICYGCAKTITDNCPGDLLDYLFGIKGDTSPRVGRDTLIRTKAKRLALEIRDANLDIQILWDFWKNNH